MRALTSSRHGGDLIFGAVEAQDDKGKSLGYPEKLIGVQDNFDAVNLRFESIVRDTVGRQGVVVARL